MLVNGDGYLVFAAETLPVGVAFCLWNLWVVLWMAVAAETGSWDLGGFVRALWLNWF